MEQGIKISVIDIDKGDDLIKYNICLSNGKTYGSLELYGYSDLFKKFADDLLAFPQNINDAAKFEAGENNKTWAYYLLLNVFCYQANGQAAIKIIIDDHKKLPDSNKVEFYIRSLPASINKLGKLLKEWNPETEKEVLW